MRILSAIRSKTYLLPAVLKRAAVMGVCAALACLLWKRFPGAGREYSFAFMSAAAVFLAIGWFHFLALDGVSLTPGPKREKRKSKPARHTGDMADYLDEDGPQGSGLSPKDRHIAALAASAACFIIYLILAVI